LNDEALETDNLIQFPPSLRVVPIPPAAATSASAIQLAELQRAFPSKYCGEPGQRGRPTLLSSHHKTPGPGGTGCPIGITISGGRWGGGAGLFGKAALLG